MIVKIVGIFFVVVGTVISLLFWVPGVYPMNYSFSRYEITWPFFQFRYGSLCRSALFSGHVIFFTTA